MLIVIVSPPWFTIQRLKSVFHSVVRWLVFEAFPLVPCTFVPTLIPLLWRCLSSPSPIMVVVYVGLCLNFVYPGWLLCLTMLWCLQTWALALIVSLPLCWYIRWWFCSHLSYDGTMFTMYLFLIKCGHICVVYLIFTLIFSCVMMWCCLWVLCIIVLFGFYNLRLSYLVVGGVHYWWSWTPLFTYLAHWSSFIGLLLVDVELMQLPCLWLFPPCSQRCLYASLSTCVHITILWRYCALYLWLTSPTDYAV